MTRDDLLTILRACVEAPHQRTNPEGYDSKEDRHITADEALLAFINDPEITTLFHAIDKWYS